MQNSIIRKNIYTHYVFREGAQTTIYCAVDESLNGITGKYYSDCQEVKTGHPLAEDEETAKKLWEISAKMVNLP